jgi:competence protein ComEC
MRAEPAPRGGQDADAGPPGRRIAALEAARGSLLPWAPVFLSLGIGGYFALPQEPGAAVWAGLGLGLALCLLLAVRGPALWHVPGMAVALVLAGALLAILRAHAVAAPVLTFRYHGPVEGRIVQIDRSFSDVPRITLDALRLARLAPERTPARVLWNAAHSISRL